MCLDTATHTILPSACNFCDVICQPLQSYNAKNGNFLTLSQTTNFRLFQTDDNFKFGEYGRKFS